MINKATRRRREPIPAAPHHAHLTGSDYISEVGTKRLRRIETPRPAWLGRRPLLRGIHLNAALRGPVHRDSEWHFGLDGAIAMANAYPATPLLLHHWGCVDAPDFPPFNPTQPH